MYAYNSYLNINIVTNIAYLLHNQANTVEMFYFFFKLR